MDPIRVTVWGENVHERCDPQVRAIYPDGMHETIAAGLREQLGVCAVVRAVTLQEPEQGLAPESWRGPTCCSGGDTWPTTRLMTRSSTACRMAS